MSELNDSVELDRLSLPTRVRSVLDEAKCKTVGDVRQKSDRELRAIRGCGRWAIRRIREACGYKAATETHAVPTVPNLRDHFAGLAMAQIIARGEVTNDAIALYAYKQADAMLKARGQ
jgi:hypothetical protein